MQPSSSAQITPPAVTAAAAQAAFPRLFARAITPAAFGVLFVLTLWIITVWHLASEWSLNTQYRYGWVVPLLAVYLFTLRVPTRPSRGRALSAPMAGIALIVLALAVAAALPFREANPDWRLLGWLFAAVATVATFLLLARIGGWPWVRHFAFPILFFLTAVPWPRQHEAALMAGLMRGNATVAAEGLRWLGYEAATRGNLIQLPAGIVTVDGACSGVRALQGFLMMTLFLGELLQLSPARRVLLLAGGIVWSLAANLARTTSLGWIAAHSGLPAMDRWHDTIGYVTLSIGFLVLLGLAALFRRQSPASPNIQAHAAAAPAPVAAALAAFREIAPVSILGLSLLALSFIGTQGWFFWHERGATRLPAWSVRFPTERPSFREEKISEPVQGQLFFDEGRAARWADDAGRRWHAFYLRWAPGRTWEQSVLVHDPRVCLQSSGMQLIETLPDLPVQHGRLHLDFESYHFRDRGAEVFVFNCVASDLIRPAGAIASVALSRSARWNTTLAGLRHRGQRRLEIGIWGATSAADATEALRDFLGDHLILSQP